MDRSLTAAALLLALTSSCTDPGPDGPADADTDTDTDTDTSALDIPAGTLLFEEPFDDADFTARGWYDGSSGTITADAHDGDGAFECLWEVGDQVCRDGRPARHAIPATESVYLSYWVKYSDNWVGSQRPYHPHEFHFTTDLDSQWVGPANSHLTLYIENVDDEPRLAMQDSVNVDEGCILRNDDSVVGCGGDLSSYAFTEARSAASCNGLTGDYDSRDCFFGSYWYSAKGWRAGEDHFVPGAWHFVEAYFELNTIEDGIGVPDGKIRYALDGTLLMSSDEVLLRTGEHPGMRFAYFLMTPYIGDGSPVEQAALYDALTVATGRPP